MVSRGEEGDLDWNQRKNRWALCQGRRELRRRRADEWGRGWGKAVSKSSSEDEVERERDKRDRWRRSGL